MRFLCFVLALVLGVQLNARELTDLRSFGDESMTTMYLFTSPSCPHCRDFHKAIFPELIRRYVKTNKAQVIIVDMPYDKVTMHAVMLMRCLPEEKATKLMGWLYEHQNDWMTSRDPDAIFERYAQVLGMYFTDFKSCLGNEKLEQAITEQRDNLSALFRVFGWPTIVLKQGNTVKFYTGTDKRTILTGLEKEITKFRNERKQDAAKK